MDPSPEQVQMFGVDARRRRSSATLSATVVAERLTELLGRTVKHQSVTAWERGEYGPQDYETAAALDRVLGAGGELVALLVGDTSTVPERLERLEALVSEQQKTLRAILRRLDRGGRG